VASFSAGGDGRPPSPSLDPLSELPSHSLDPLLERDAELRRLEETLGVAEAGSGSLTLIESAAGVGKSSLLAQACERAREAGFLVLAAKADELERSFAFGVAIQLFAEPARQVAEGDPNVFAGAAQLAMPLLERGAPPPPGSDPNPAFPLLHGLHWLTASLAERAPLLITVDDAHWSDPLSLRFLAYLTQRAEALPVAIALTIRTGEPMEPEDEKLLARLRDHPFASAIALSPLGEASVRELVVRALPDADPPLQVACYEATGGNPFLLHELLATAREQEAISAPGVATLHPEAINNSILVRLGRLGEDASRLAVAVAVLGPAAAAQLSTELAGLDPEAATAAADALIAAQILSPGPPLTFVHPIVREVIYADLAPGRRRQEHASAARLLHESDRPAQEVAPQLLAAGPVGEAWAPGVLREAAGQALGRGAPATAVRLLRQAIEEAERRNDPALLLELGRAADSAALEHLEAARAAAREPQARAMVAGALGQARYVLGQTREAFESIREALAQIPPGKGGPPEAELLWYGLAAGRIAPDLVDEVPALLEPAREGPGGSPTSAEIVRRACLAFDALLRGDREAAVREFDWVQARAGEEGTAAALPPSARASIWFCLWLLGRYGEARAVLDREVERATRRGSLFELGPCLEARLGVSWARGDVNDCLADVETLLGLNEEGWETATVPTRTIAAEMLLERDDQAGAVEVLAPAEAVESRLPGTSGWLWLPYGRARLAIAAGDWSAALEQALEAGERLLAIEAPGPDYLPWRSLAARAAARLGETERALSLAEEELGLARSAGSPRATGVALAALGAIRGADEGLQLLDEAVEVLDSTEAELEPARARLELGVALHRARRQREARRPLEEALDAARRLGSTHLAERALSELRAAGGRPRRAALSGVESLTPSERRVAEMAAQGMSNREIAEALFLTRRTVETHLTHVYSKLEIGSREELPAALGMAEGAK
jgi:DNA-binding CsgD family transcriptional regulator